MSNIDLNYGDINLYILSPWRKRIGLYCSSTTLPLSILIGICLSFSAASSSAQTFGGNGGGSQSGGCIESPGVGGGLGGEVGHDGSDGGARGYCAGSGGGGGGANGGAGGGLVAFQIFKTTELVVQVVQVARLRSRSAATTTIRKNCPAATERRDSRVPI